MPSNNIPFFSEDDVRACLTYDALFLVLRGALVAYSAGRPQLPLRSVLPVAEYGGWFAAMPAVLGDVMGAKLVTFYPGNVAIGKPTHMAMIQLFRASNGELLAGATLQPRPGPTVFKSVGIAVEDIAAAKLVEEGTLALERD